MNEFTKIKHSNSILNETFRKYNKFYGCHLRVYSLKSVLLSANFGANLIGRRTYKILWII